MKNFNGSRDSITVLGLNRYRRYEYEDTPKEWIENIRFAKVYKPKILEMMREYEGFNGWWVNSDEDGLDVKLFAERWRRYRAKGWRLVPEWIKIMCKKEK